MMDRNQLEKAAAKRGGLRILQWSIMLVGEHGRIIPLQRFRTLAVAVVSVLVLLLIGSISLAVMATYQSRKIHFMESRLQEVQQRAEKLKLERDIHLAELVITRERQTSGDSRSGIENRSTANLQPELSPDNFEPVGTEAENQPQREMTPAEEVKEAPPTKRGATAREVKIDYDHEKKTLRARFKIVNTSQPKRTLSGRCVAIFKQGDDPPVKWVVVPRVLLDNGKPAGDSGHEFRIRNYKTIELEAFEPEAAFDLNIATISIFAADGEELFIKDYPFSIAPGPAPASSNAGEPESATRSGESENPLASPLVDVAGSDPQATAETSLKANPDAGSAEPAGSEDRDQAEPDTASPQEPEGEISERRP